MGVHEVTGGRDEQEVADYTRAALRDLAALERMLDGDRFESGVRRIGAEQEMFLVDEAMRPAPLALDVLDVLAAGGDDRFTTEIGRFNLEANLQPQLLEAGCLRRLDADITDTVAAARRAAQSVGADVLLAGILPTLRHGDLGLDNLTPLPRYQALDRSLRALRGSEFTVHIKGVDELQVTHDNVMFEACNASYQVHFQVDPRHFARDYNIAQVITGPLVAAAVNSPLLLGHRLWHETRIALFQHAVDERSTPRQVRSHPPRVGFGDAWVNDSVLELFRDNLTRFKALLVGATDDDPLECLSRGGTPKLTALLLHNGTVWRWNRACYGVVDGTPSLRVENRVLPSGPTVLDEVANAAFFIGLMCAMPEEYGDIRPLLAFDDAKDNLFASARHGLDAQFTWLDGRRWPAQALILELLLPLARSGLASGGLDAEEINTYLGVVQERVSCGQTAARWALRCIAASTAGTTAQRDKALVAAMATHQRGGEPVHRWPTGLATAADNWRDDYRIVEQVMSTDLFTVGPDEPIDLVASVMDWRHVRHVPVEDADGRLVGLISHRDLLRTVAAPTPDCEDPTLTARALMKSDPVTVTPQTTTLAAMEVMRDSGVGCLPVLQHDRLVGIITASDLLMISYRCLAEAVSASDGVSASSATPVTSRSTSSTSV